MKEKRNILVVANRLLGDGLDTFPALWYIFKYLPTSEQPINFDLLASRYNQSLYQNFPFNRIFLVNERRDYLDKKNLSFLFFSWKKNFRLWKSLRNRYQMVIIFPGSFGWALWARLLKAPLIVGHRVDGRGLLLTHRIPYSRSQPNYENFLLLGLYAVSAFHKFIKTIPKKKEKISLESLDLDKIKRCLPDLVSPPLPQSDNWKKKILSTIRSKSPFPKRYVVISPIASEKNKIWPGERFYQVALQLFKRGYKIFWVGLKQDFDLIETISNAMERKKKVGYNVSGILDLPQVFTLIKKSQGFIGNDSGLAHAATMMGTKTVVIYGHANPTLSWPLGGINLGGTKKAGKKNNQSFCQVYREYSEIPHKWRRRKIYRETLNINRITFEEAWEKIDSFFP